MSTREDQVSRYWLTEKGYAALAASPVVVVDEDESGDDE